MRSIMKRVFDQFSKKNTYNMDIICNSPTDELYSFCSMEYRHMKKRSNERLI
ncbi:MAG: hypothetical protein K0R80_2625 [Clostridia bacterium]|jgi:hypothetical protein|nr:hypothetical protein [Clostridia bacterium]MDF2892258.1 hypothetical protein [Clostridia bacterium]